MLLTAAALQLSRTATTVSSLSLPYLFHRVTYTYTLTLALTLTQPV